jgi:hypothetical protein
MRSSKRKPLWPLLWLRGNAWRWLQHGCEVRWPSKFGGVTGQRGSVQEHVPFFGGVTITPSVKRALARQTLWYFSVHSNLQTKFRRVTRRRVGQRLDEQSCEDPSLRPAGKSDGGE